jgi:hypothetical protein
LGHVLGDHKGLFHQFDLLDSFLLVGDSHQSVGSIHRTARQLIEAVVIDLRWAEGRGLMFGMARLTSDLAALAPAQPLGAFCLR